MAVAGVPSHPTDAFRFKFGLAPYPRPGEPDTRWRCLDCDANDPRSAWKWGELTLPTGERRNGVTGTSRVWACATELEGRWLIYAFAPVKLGVVRLTIPGAGDVRVDLGGKPYGYWLCEPAGIRATRLEVE